MNDDQSAEGWAAFFGVIATSLALVSIVLAVGVGILIGYYAIGSGGNSSSHSTVLAQATGTGGSRSAANDTSGTATAALVSAGEGLKAPAGVTATLWGSGLPGISDLAYDSKGRLWATAATDHGTVPPPGNGVYLLEKGKAPLKVVSDVKTPIGLAWYHEELIVSNNGYIEAYSGFNGHSFAQHKVLIKHIGGGEEGWSDNPAVGPEGRIYVEDGDGCDAVCPKVGYLEDETISFNPDGTGLKVFAHKVRGNGFSEFMPGTDDLFEVMNQQNALVPAPDDQLGIVREGSDWGLPTCYGQGGAACNGIAKAIAYLPQHNGSAGMALVNGQLGQAYGTSAFITSVTKGTVDRVALTKSGNSYTASGSPYEFLTGLKAGDPIVLTPRGSLLVGDYAVGKIYELSVNQSVAPGASASIPIKVPATVAGKIPAAAPAVVATTTTTSAGAAPAAASSSATVEANPSGALAYVQKSVTLKSGASTLEFVNKSPLGHDIVIEQSGKKFGETPVINGGTAKLSLHLKPGTYKFYCSVPGHRMAGMEGTITVP
jgi:glucose/arabinose dehydrogenase/plastocyanin